MLICNTRCLQTKLTGVQRYTTEILKHFPGEKVKCFSPSDNIARGMFGHLWEQIVLPTKLKKQLLWSPSNSGPLSVSNQVVTIHDLVPIDHPEWLNKYFAEWYNFITPRLIKTVTHIITISEFSKQRLIDLYKVPDSKITIVYNGINAQSLLHSVYLKPKDLPFERYVLSLGSLEPRKNLPLLFKAWENILDKIPEDVGLVVVGGVGNTKVFRDNGISSVPDRVKFLGHVDDREISYLYENALSFVYLSIYEGFGLPPLEAMAFGTPVLTGNKTSLPEVVGDAGLMIDPLSVNECENALIKLILDKDYRQTLSVKGKQRASNFDWKTSSSSTWKVLEKYL